MNDTTSSPFADDATPVFPNGRVDAVTHAPMPPDMQSVPVLHADAASADIDAFTGVEALATGPQAEARMVAYSRGRHVAFSGHATQELIEHPEVQVVPGAAYYGYGLLWWQQRHIPLIHLESVLRAYPAFDPAVPPQFALVLAYQTAPREPLQYGAITVTDIPYSQRVSDADFCPLPKDSDMWEELAISCFRHQEQAIPVLDAARIFSAFHG
ncbi:MAG: chemotaxis protein CheW [Brachymonas sp.]|nr:chemotaxis protein CheW [Brachymonas sp.]